MAFFLRVAFFLVAFFLRVAFFLVAFFLRVAFFLVAFFLVAFFLRVAFFLADFFFAMALFPCLITTEPAAHLIETVSSSQQLFCDPTQIFYRLIVPCS
ncbi:MAG: hypothetical protein CMJ18_20435 [Phycisphaeraceae bacterium]|nr:hypothetical protein [Phycisphaeraceae bacterium]